GGGGRRYQRLLEQGREQRVARGGGERRGGRQGRLGARARGHHGAGAQPRVRAAGEQELELGVDGRQRAQQHHGGAAGRGGGHALEARGGGRAGEQQRAHAVVGGRLARQVAGRHVGQARAGPVGRGVGGAVAAGEVAQQQVERPGVGLAALDAAAGQHAVGGGQAPRQARE